MPFFVQFEFPTSEDGRYMTLCAKDKILFNRRLSLGLTQEELADIANVSVQQIQKLEAGDITISSLGLRKGLALCAALLLDPYEMADVDCKQPSIFTLQSMPTMAYNHNIPEKCELFNVDSDGTIKASNAFVYFNQPLDSSVLISREALEILEKPKYIQVRWLKRAKFFIFTGAETLEAFETPKIYAFDVPSETYDKKNLGLIIMNFEPIREVVADLGWDKDEHTYVAKCHALLAKNQNDRRYFLCNLNEAKKSDNWKGAFTQAHSWQ